MFLHIRDQNYVSVHFGIVYHGTLAGPEMEERLHSNFLARMQGICIWQFKTLFAANSPLGFLEFCCTKHVYSHGAFVRILSVIKEHLLYSKSDKKRR